MKKILKALLSLIGLFLIFVTLTCFYYFIKHTWFGPSTGRTAHVAVVEIKGVLLSSSRTVREIQEVLDTPQAKALVIRINSPGGLVAPSQEIFEAVKKADKKIPVVISMASVAASGGYYIALGGRKIIANPGTLTASIGVIMEFMNVEKLYQWAKIDAFSLTSGKLKDAGSPLRPMSPDEKNYFKSLLTNIHSQFRKAVQVQRHLTPQETLLVTDGRVMTGEQALEAKLVDALGGMEDALSTAKTLAKLPENAPVSYPEENTGLLKSLLMGEKAEEASSSISRLIEQTIRPGWNALLLAPIHLN